jgi:hypothetical protein
MFTEEDVPLAGGPGRIDSLLGGEASRQIAAGRLSGALGSQALLATRGRLESGYVLFAGLGSVKKITASTIAVRTEEIVQCVLKLAARTLALPVFQPPGTRAKYERLASETVNGALRGGDDFPYDIDITVCEPDPARYNELVAVAERSAFRRAEGRELSVEIIV